MLTVEQYKLQMGLMAEWSKIEEYENLMSPPKGREEEHLLKVKNVYDNSFQDVLKVWNKLPKSQWEVTRAIARDLPEWKDLREVLITFRKQLKKVKRIVKPKTETVAKSDSDQEGQDLANDS